MFKTISIFVAAAVLFMSANSALAAFDDLKLIRVVYERTTGTTEYVTDLGDINNLITNGGSFAGSLPTVTNTNNLFVVYFAIERDLLNVSGVNVPQFWVSGNPDSTKAPVAVGAAGFVQTKSGTINVFSYYKTLPSDTDGVTIGAQSYANSYMKKLTASQGSFGNGINIATRVNSEANLSGLITGAATTVSQNLYYFANANLGGSKGVAVATITTNADGSTTITPITPTAPGTPTNVTATASDSQATVSFTAPASNGNSAITEYTVTSSPAGGVDTTAVLTATTRTITGLTNGTPYTFTVTATNSIGTSNPSAPSNSVTPVSAVTAITPTITWTNPTDITYGTALSTTQLNAVAIDPATSIEVAGFYAYSPPLDSILAAGPQNLSVIFTPTDTTAYTTATATVNITITKATATVSAWPTASTITYGQTLASSTLTGGTGSVSGTFAFTTPATAPNAGTANQDVTFSPTDAANYTTASGTVNVTVNKATATVSAWPTASAITYGQTLASSTLTGGTGSVPGTFAFTTSTTSPNAGTANQDVTFSPTDTANYTTASGTVSVTVSKATATVTTWPTASAITYGQTLASSTLTGGTGSVSGTFAFTAPASAPNAGTANQDVTFSPTDTVNYSTVTGTTSVTISKATPAITWSTPSAITYGTALSGTQLNATASTGGAFTYTPSQGTVLGNGNQTLSVTFTPTDATNFTNASMTIGLTVNPTVQIVGDKGYDTMPAALMSINKDVTIQARDIYASVPAEALTFNNGFNVTLKGGLDAGWNTTAGFTTIQGKLTIQSGKLIVSGVKVK